MTMIQDVAMGFERIGSIWLYLGVYFGASGFIFTAINKAQPGPYMDEIFHVPQAQRYCNGSFNEWDPKITTLPGSYIMTVLLVKPLEFLGFTDTPCSTLFLRGVNLVISGGNLVQIYMILFYYMPESSKAKRAAAAFNIATFPVLFFFSFLYYTDTISTFFVLLTHLLWLQGRFERSAIAGACAVFVRQTNVIWVFWHGLLNIWDIGQEVLHKYCIEGNRLFGDSGSRTLLRNQNRAAKKLAKDKNENGKSVPIKQLIFPPPSFEGLKLLISKIIERMLHRDVIFLAAWYVVVGSIFGAFVVLNGGIVVGDKQAHQASVNVPQMGYFAIVYGCFTFPFLLRRARRTVHAIGTNPRKVLLVQLIFWLGAYYNTAVHPYLLADNRHYTFYVWKKLFVSCPWMKIMIVPIYVIIWSFLLVNMNVKEKYKLTFATCCALNLVPQSLLEFRYFIPAYLFARMPMVAVEWDELFMEISMHMFINAYTVQKFLYHPFRWPDSDDIQRFMW